MQRTRYGGRMAKTKKATQAKPKTAHEAVLQQFIPAEKRADFDARVAARAARNVALSTIEQTRSSKDIAKKDLAAIAGLDASSLRRMLTAETPNPTTDTVFRLCAALDIKLEATLPGGDHVAIV